jgi:mRNA interferase HigB
VRVVSKRRIRDFGRRFPKAVEPLTHWANAVQAAWKNPGALKARFGSADFVGDLTVFHVGGNKYRSIAFVVHYLRQIVFVKQILTHEEYDQGDWKS